MKNNLFACLLQFVLSVSCALSAFIAEFFQRQFLFSVGGIFLSDIVAGFAFSTFKSKRHPSLFLSHVE
jgi:hypothetical protein